VLALDFAATEFQQALPLRKPPAGSPLRAPGRRGARLSGAAPENGEKPVPIAP